MSNLLELDFGKELLALQNQTDEIELKVAEVTETEQSAAKALASVRKLQKFVDATKAKKSLAESAIFTESELTVVQTRYQEAIDTAELLIEEAKADPLYEVALQIERAGNLQKGREAKGFYERFDEWLEDPNVLEAMGRRLSKIASRWRDDHDGEKPTSAEWESQAYADIRAYVNEKFPESSGLKDHQRRVERALNAARKERDDWRYENNIGGFRDRVDANNAKKAKKGKRAGMNDAQVAEAQAMAEKGVVVTYASDPVTQELAEKWDV